MIEMHRCLVDYDIAMLRALAHTRGVALTSNRPNEAIDRLAEDLLAPISVRIALAHLTPGARVALAALMGSGGRMRAPQFTRRYGEIRPSGPGRLAREEPWREPVSAAEELYYLGLVFRGFFSDAAGSGEFVFIPDDLFPLLPLSTVDAAFTVDSVPPPELQGAGGPDLVQDIFTYLAYLQTHDVQPYTDGRLGRRDLADLLGRMTDRDGRRLSFLRHLVGRMGFVANRNGCLRLEAGPVKQWLSAPLSAQLLAVQIAWRDDPTLIDLCQVPNLACDEGANWLRRVDPVATRQAVLSWLSKCLVNDWWSIRSFVEAMKQTDPDFQRPDGDYTDWFIRDTESGDYLSGFESWNRVEGRFLQDLLSNPLCWLGVVATGASDGDPVCSLTDSGARLLGLLPAAADDLPTASLVLHSDYRIDLPQPVSLYARFQLERFADLEREEPCRYRLTVGSLDRAFQRGIRVDQVLAFLHESCEVPVPAKVVTQLRLWADRFNQVDLEDMALVRVKHERVLRELSSLPETRFLITQVLSPTRALVRGRDLPRFRRALRDLGFLPHDAEDRAGDSGDPD